MRILRYTAVSPRRQQVIRICQALNFGALCDIRLENADPVLEGGSIVSEERLDLAEEPRPEIQLQDFNLSQEWCRLFSRFDDVQRSQRRYRCGGDAGGNQLFPPKKSENSQT